MQLIKIILTIHILIFVFSINYSLVLGQTTKDSSDILEYKSSRFSLAFLPAIFIPVDGDVLRYSVGYGFDINISYQLIEDIKISGNIETIFSNFKMGNLLGGSDHKAKTLWLSSEIGPKYYLNKGISRIYLNFHFKFTQIYHWSGKNYYITKNPETAFGLNFGFGIEIPVNNYLTLEVNPTYNILFPASNEQYFGSESSYYKISVGLNHNF